MRSKPGYFFFETTKPEDRLCGFSGLTNNIMLLGQGWWPSLRVLASSALLFYSLPKMYARIATYKMITRINPIGGTTVISKGVTYFVAKMKTITPIKTLIITSLIYLISLKD